MVIAAMALTAFAQSPQKMSYQCVVRNSSGALVANQAVGMKISILQGSATGTVVFSETYSPNPQTNANGLVTIEIGGGTTVTGSFSGINWASGPFFLKTETDPAGGTSYTITGTSQLLSVPYALYAKTAANGFSGAWADITGKPAFAAVSTSGSYNDLLNKPSLFSGSYNDLTNKPVLFDGTWTSLTGKPTFATVATSGSYNDLLNRPTLFDGTWTSLTGKPAGFADGTDNVDDADNSITNEIQALSLSGTVLSLSSGGGSVTLPSSGGGDNWGTQTVVTNTTLTGVGTAASPLAVANTVITPSWTRIQGIPAGFADGTDNIDDADNSITNEIQTLNLSGTTLTLSSGGGSVTLPSSGGGDNWGTQVVVTDVSLAGNGTTATPLMIPDNGVTAAKIASGAVTTAKILDGTVSNADLADNSVTTLKIADGAIATADLANSTVTTDKLGNLAVSAEKIQSGAVTSDKLAANSVTSAKIAAAAVTGDKISQAGATAGQVLKWNSTTWAPANDETGSGGLTLPFSGSATIDGATLEIINTFSTGPFVNQLIGIKGKSMAAHGTGVYGEALQNGGSSRGVNGRVRSEQGGIGVLGENLSLSGNGYGVWGESASEVGSGVYGLASNAMGANYGVYGVTMSPDGYGVYGTSGNVGVKGIVTGITGARFGVFGETQSTGGYGVYGHAGATTGANYGVYGKTLSSEGCGVKGWATSTAGTNYGVYGETTSSEGSGVFGNVTATTGINYGVHGQSHSVSGYGVFGESPKFGVYGTSTDGTGRAVLGEATGTASIGVMGIGTNTSSTGVWGEGANQGVYGTSPSATGRGVYGQVSSATGFSGYFEGGKFYVNGNTGIKTTDPTQALDVNGNARIRSIGSGAYAGVVNRTADGTLTTATSDGRLKENVQTLTKSLEKVMQLHGVTFTWKKNPEYGTRIGFIAQEFEKVIPELVFTNEVDGYKGINYAEVSAVLVEAIKEQQKQIQDQQKEIDELKALISSLSGDM